MMLTATVIKPAEYSSPCTPNSRAEMIVIPAEAITVRRNPTPVRTGEFSAAASIISVLSFHGTSVALNSAVSSPSGKAVRTMTATEDSHVSLLLGNHTRNPQR